MIAILDAAREFFAHPKPKPRPDRYRLVRPTGRYYDAYHWAARRGIGWHSADERRRALEAWLVLRQRHHVAWLERGGTS